MLCLDWNTLIVGKLSSWIEADSELENVRRNSEAVSSSPSNVQDKSICEGIPHSSNSILACPSRLWSRS